MRKFLGTLALIVILVVGFFGCTINMFGTTFNIPPFISNYMFGNDDDKKVDEPTQDLTTAIAKEVVRKTIK